MNSLSDEKCEVCRAGSPRLSASEISDLSADVPGWQVVDRDKVLRLQRTFSFDDFAGALEFTNKVGQLAEAAGHHPTITTRWGGVAVTWCSHKIRGLHRNDFIMAAQTDRVYQRQSI